MLQFCQLLHVPLVLEEFPERNALQLVTEFANVTVTIQLVAGAVTGTARSALFDDLERQEVVDVIVDGRSAETGLPGNLAHSEVTALFGDKDADHPCLCWGTK